MTRAVRRTKKDMEFDARDAVRDAAERAGLSVSEWIERVVIAYADQIGISALDIDDEVRREALEKRIETMARNSARESLRRSDFDVLDLVHERPKRRRARQLDLDEDERNDYVTRRTDRNDSERRYARARPERVTMRSIEEAVSEIARRQHHLAQERDYENPSLSLALKSEIAHLAQRLEEARAEFSQSNLTRNVEERIDQLSTRIDEVMKEISGQLNAPKHDLETLHALQAQIAQLSARMERSDLSADGMNALQRTMVDLFRYIEDMRTAAAEQAQRSEAQSKELQVLRTLEDHLAALTERVGRSDLTRDGLASVEATLSELFQHIEDTRRAALDASAKADHFIQAENQILHNLTQRVDRTEHHISAISSIEQGMSALFQEFRSSQQAAAQMAERAVREALSAQSGALTAQMQGEMDDLRQSQAESERRTHSSLSSIHETLDKVVDCIALMEEGGAQGAPRLSAFDLASQPHTASPSPMPAMPQAAPLSPSPMMRSATAAPVFAAVDEPSTYAHSPAPDIHVDPSEHDHLIEPGQAPMPMIGADMPPQQLQKTDDQTQFINAARKAGGQKPLPRLTMTIADDAPTSSASIGKLRSLLSARKLLVALIGCGVLLGAEQALQPRLAMNTAASLVPVVQSPQSVTPPQPKSRLSLNNTDQTASIPQRQKDVRPDEAIQADVNKVAPQNYAEQAANVPLATLRDAAQNGNAAAQYEYANRLAEGRGISKDQFGAAMWYEKAALQNLPPAQYMSGTLYEKGVGVAKDLRRARDWYQRAADLGHVRAMHNLASLYADGVDGKPDYSTAAIWFRRAAEYGVRDSQYNLAILYGRGLGIELSLAQAYAWFSLAAQQGDEEAARKRDDVAARLDQKQMVTAKTFIATFRQRMPDVASNEVVPQGGWDSLRADSKPTKPRMTRVIN